MPLSYQKVQYEYTHYPKEWTGKVDFGIISLTIELPKLTVTVGMAQRPMRDTEPRVQQLSHGLYTERCIGSQGLASAGLCVFQKNDMKKIYYCNICNRNTNVKRHIGAGSILLVLITGGLWLLALPFYRKRCVFCKGRNLKIASEESGIE